MTLPRMIRKNSTYLITRRCTQRQFLLMPSKQTNDIFKYCLALAAERTNISVHAFVVLSNHYHLVVTDNEGNVPEFTAYLNKFVAKCMNAVLGRWENFWSTESPSMVVLVDEEDILDKIVYTICNPVSAYLVDRSSEWPGLCVTKEEMLKGEVTAKRPKVFFRENGGMPESVNLKITVPKIVNCFDESATVGTIYEKVAEREAEVRRETKAKKIKFLGVRRMLRQDPFSRPKTKELRRGLNPRVAAKNKWARIEALQRIKSWLKAYREAWNEWKSGKRDVEFPAGTYALVRYSGVRCTAAL